MIMAWQFLNTGFLPGFRNMEIDAELARNGTNHPTLRVYGWSPPAISLGWNQSWDEIRLDAASAAGIDVVRRPTGGRAILHEHELTYSVVMPSRGENIGAVYNRISLALVEGLRFLGVRAVLERSQPHFSRLYRTAEASACFVSSARHEIMVDGKKLVGSAQRRLRTDGEEEMVLQHGSILLGAEHQRIVDFLVLTPGERQHLSDQLRQRTTDLRQLLRREVSFEEASAAIARGFEEAWGIRFETDAVTHSTE